MRNYAKKDQILLTRISIIIIFTITILSLLFVSLVVAEPIEINAHYDNFSNLEFNWSYEQNVNIYLNGELKESNTSVNRYILNDIIEGDRYLIYLENLNQTDSGENDYTIPYTLYSPFSYLLIIAWIICIIFIAFISEVFIIPTIFIWLMLFYDVFNYYTYSYQILVIPILLIISFIVVASTSRGK